MTSREWNLPAVEALEQSIDTLADMTARFYKGLVTSGMPEETAMVLTDTYLSALMPRVTVSNGD